MSLQPLQVCRPGEPVQEGSLRIAREQAVGLPLPMDLHQPAAHRRQRRGGREVSAGSRRPPTVRADASSQDELAILGPVGQVARGGLWHREARLDRESLAARPDQVGTPPPPEHQSEGQRDHGLPGAGLARQHVQPRRQLEGRLANDPEAGHVQLLEHSSPLSRTR